MPRIIPPHNFTLRDYQQKFWLALVEEHRTRLDWVVHRRGGKDLTAWNAVIQLAQQRVGLYLYSLPTYGQAKSTIWRGITNDGLRFLDCLPPSIVADANETDMLITLTNGSLMQLVGGDNYNRIVGTNPVCVVFSEWSLTDPAALDYFRPMIAANNGTLIFLYTPRGTNHGKTLHETYSRLALEQPETYFSEVLTVDDTDGAMPAEAIERDRAEGMPDELIRQEYYCDFTAPLVGSYYAKLLADARHSERVTRVPHDPARGVETWWDVGVGDDTCIWFVQRRGPALDVIDYHADNGQPLSAYAQVLEDKRQQLGYRYSRHLGPHDIQQRSKTDAKSYAQTARELGVSFQVVPQGSVAVGIERVRAIIPRCWFDEARCKRGLEALEAYSRRWNSALRQWANEPLHDWASHAADAFRTGAMAPPPGGALPAATRERLGFQHTG